MLTAIVISFGMTALIVVLALRGYLETGSDGVEAAHETPGATIKDGERGRGSIATTGSSRRSCCRRSPRRC